MSVLRSYMYCTFNFCSVCVIGTKQSPLLWSELALDVTCMYMYCICTFCRILCVLLYFYAHD